MKIVYVLENYYPNIGGVETLFKSLIESLAKEGHQITIITSRITPDSPLKEKNGAIQISRMPFNNRYLFTFLGLFYIIPHLKNCDLVHTTSYNAGIPAFFASKLFGKKVIITFHEVWTNLWFRLPYMGKIAKIGHYLFEQVLLKLPFDHFVGVSHSTSKNLQKAGIKKERITTIYNGINYDHFQLPASSKKAKETEKFTFTYFGRLGISKGLDLLMEAILVFNKKHPGIQFKLIVPKVPASFLKRIIAFIERFQLEDTVFLLHHLSFETLKKEIAQTNCVIIPSYSEGFCFAAVETIALGVPLISSNQTALKEVVSGKFIKMETLSAAGLVNAMEKAIVGQWETSPLKKFELKDTINNYKSLYKKGAVIAERQVETSCT